MNGFISILLSFSVFTAQVSAYTEGQYLPTITGKYVAAEHLKKLPPRQPRIILFTATWCEPCQRMKKDCFEWLKAAGWQVDSSDRAHLQVIDIDENPILTKAYGIDSIPTLLLISDDKVIDRSAYFGRKTFGDMLKKLER